MRCIVLSGATVPFTSLIEAIDAELVAKLQELGYSEILVQYGHARSSFPPQSGVVGFDFDPEISNHVHNSDLVITHAGAGSLLDALERGTAQSSRKIIVVINTELMGNHQTELAYKLRNLGCVMVAESPRMLLNAVIESSNRQFNQLEPPRSIDRIIKELMA